MHMRLLILALALALAACQPISAPHAPAACSDAALIEIEARYIAEIVAACEGQSYDDCDARPAIDARYDRLRSEWVYCR